MHMSATDLGYGSFTVAYIIPPVQSAYQIFVCQTSIEILWRYAPLLPYRYTLSAESIVTTFS